MGQRVGGGTAHLAATDGLPEQVLRVGQPACGVVGVRQVNARAQRQLVVVPEFLGALRADPFVAFDGGRQPARGVLNGGE